MKKLSGWAIVVLVGAVLAVTVVSVAATGPGRSVTYQLGEPVVFRIVNSPANCCCCQPGPTVKILGWRITTACGKVIHAVTYKTPIAAADWQGQWPEVDLNAVSTAEAKVETSSPGTVYQAWKNAMSTYEQYWNGVESPIAPGWYVLYVDTTAGTLSRSLQLYDPMGRHQFYGNRPPCEQPMVLTNCCWYTKLVVSVEHAPQYRFLTWHVGPCRPRH